VKEYAGYVRRRKRFIHVLDVGNLCASLITDIIWKGYRKHSTVYMGITND
jgi:hypothetical protein